MQAGTRAGQAATIQETAPASTLNPGELDRNRAEDHPTPYIGFLECLIFYLVISEQTFVEHAANHDTPSFFTSGGVSEENRLVSSPVAALRGCTRKQPASSLHGLHPGVGNANGPVCQSWRLAFGTVARFVPDLRAPASKIETPRFGASASGRTTPAVGGIPRPPASGRPSHAPSGDCVCRLFCPERAWGTDCGPSGGGGNRAADARLSAAEILQVAATPLDRARSATGRVNMRTPWGSPLGLGPGKIWNPKKI